MGTEGEVERGVLPFSQHRPGGRVEPNAEASASQTLVDVETESDQRVKAQRLFEALKAQIGVPEARLCEDQLGRISVAEPSPLGHVLLTSNELCSALTFAINAVYHHTRYQRQLEHDRALDAKRA